MIEPVAPPPPVQGDEVLLLDQPAVSDTIAIDEVVQEAVSSTKKKRKKKKINRRIDAPEVVSDGASVADSGRLPMVDVIEHGAWLSATDRVQLRARIVQVVRPAVGAGPLPEHSVVFCCWQGLLSDSERQQVWLNLHFLSTK